MRRLSLLLVVTVLLTVSHSACNEDSNTITRTRVVVTPVPRPTPAPAYLVGNVEYVAARGSAPARGVAVQVIQANATKKTATDRFFGHFEVDGLVSGPATLEAGGACVGIAHLVLVPGKNTGGLTLPCHAPGY